MRPACQPFRHRASGPAISPDRRRCPHARPAITLAGTVLTGIGLTSIILFNGLRPAPVTPH